MTIFELAGQFFFQNDVFQLQEDFREHEIRVFLENGLGRHFQTFLILHISDKPEEIKKIPKTVMKTRLKIKKPLVCTLVFVKKTFWSHSEATQ
jgi:hypothetical protein